MTKSQFSFILNSLHKRLFATSPAASAVASSHSFQRLIDTYGLPSESAALISKTLQLSSSDLSDAEKSTKHLHSLFGILKDYGFSGDQIAKLIKRRPKTLLIKSDEVLPSRFRFLEEKGFTRHIVTELIATNPHFFDRGLETRLQPAWDFFRTYTVTDDNVKRAVKRWPWILTDDLNTTARPNVVLLKDHGVPPTSISKLIVSQPRAIVQSPQRMLRVIVDLKESGRDPESPMFIWALSALVNISEASLNRKIVALKSIGLTEGDIKFMFQKYPICLVCSEEKFKASFDFLVNTMKLDLPSIVARPMILRYGLEKRIRPRFNVLEILKTKNLVNEKVNFLSLVKLTDKCFLKKYVEPNQGLVPELMDVYQGSIPA